MAKRKPSLSDWLQFLESKASLKTNLVIGIGSMFIIGLIGIITIYYIIGDFPLTVLAVIILIIIYYVSIRKIINQFADEARRAENLLDEIMKEKITRIN